MPEEKKKPRFPTDLHKLRELEERLVREIAQKQDRLIEVRKLLRQAENTAILNTAHTFNVTPEEFGALVQALRSGNITPEMLTLSASDDMAASGMPGMELLDENAAELEVIDYEEV